MKLVLIFTILMSFTGFSAKNVDCKVYQEYLNETRLQKATPKEFSLNEEDSTESTYLKTVVSNLDATLTDRGVVVALKNLNGNRSRLLRFDENNKLSQTLEYPSDKPQGIYNRVRIDCLQTR